MFFLVILSGLVVIVLAIVPKVCGLKPGRGRWIFMIDKNHVARLPSRGSEANCPCLKILWHAKDPYSIKEIFLGKIHRHFSPSFSCFATRCLLVTARELWWVNQE
jgi:hypothetical protein